MQHWNTLISFFASDDRHKNGFSTGTSWCLSTQLQTDYMKTGESSHGRHYILRIKSHNLVGLTKNLAQTGTVREACPVGAKGASAHQPCKNKSVRKETYFAFRFLKLRNHGNVARSRQDSGFLRDGGQTRSWVPPRRRVTAIASSSFTRLSLSQIQRPKKSMTAFQQRCRTFCTTG